LLSICLNRGRLSKARASRVELSHCLLEFLIFLLPLSTARGRLRAEKKITFVSNYFP
jgi:hypothetical protein